MVLIYIYFDSLEFGKLITSQKAGGFELMHHEPHCTIVTVIHKCGVAMRRRNKDLIAGVYSIVDVCSQVRAQQHDLYA